MSYEFYLLAIVVVLVDFFPHRYVLQGKSLNCVMLNPTALQAYSKGKYLISIRIIICFINLISSSEFYPKLNISPTRFDKFTSIKSFFLGGLKPTFRQMQ